LIKLFSDDADDLVGAATNALYPIAKQIIENREIIKPGNFYQKKWLALGMNWAICLGLFSKKAL
jgi:hypothetical protein